jgi:hypothetical protein
MGILLRKDAHTLRVAKCCTRNARSKYDYSHLPPRKRLATITTIYSCGAHALTLTLSLRRERKKIIKLSPPNPLF